MQVNFSLVKIPVFLITGDMQGRTDRSRPPIKTVKKDPTKSDKLKYKPLTGKVFYLDIPSNVLSEKIAKDIKELGGVSPVCVC